MTDQTPAAPAPTLAQLLAARHETWGEFCATPYRTAAYWPARANWEAAAAAYAAAITAAALSRPDMTDDDRATLENPPAYNASETHEMRHAATLEKWRAIVHPQEFDAQPEK